MIGEDGEESRETLTIVRDDFWATSSNKQLNFLQHVRSLLKIDGRAAIVVPDNVQPLQLGRVLNLVLRLAEDGPPCSGRSIRPAPAGYRSSAEPSLRAYVAWKSQFMRIQVKLARSFNISAVRAKMRSQTPDGDAGTPHHTLSCG
jgi:hypothetical protein